jgi:hypothetical protein
MAANAIPARIIVAPIKTVVASRAAIAGIRMARNAATATASGVVRAET